MKLFFTTVHCLYFPFFLFSSHNSYIDYYNVTNLAEWHYDNADYEKAEKLFTSAFQLDLSPKWKDIILLCKIYNSQGKKRKKIYPMLIKKLKESGGLKFKLSPYLEEQGFTLSSKQKIMIDSYLLDTTSAQYIEYSLLNERIERMHFLDQKSRSIHSFNDSLFIDEIGLFIKSKEAIKVVDSLNFAVLLDLFLTRKLSDYEIQNYKFGTILLHLESRFFELQWFLYDMLKKGNLDPGDFARTADRAHMALELCPPFMAYRINLKDLACLTREKILENRKSIGLSLNYVRSSWSYYLSPSHSFKKPFDQDFDDAKTK
jgi:hypothetical protein